MQDALRPVVLHGWQRLSQVPLVSQLLSLEHLFLASLLGARLLDVRLRPALRGVESLDVMKEVDSFIANNGLENPVEALQLLTRVTKPPASLLRALVETMTDRWYGFES